MQLLVVEQIWTQYMWVTCRKRPGGLDRVPGRKRKTPRASVIRRISNALTGKPWRPCAARWQRSPLGRTPTR